MLRPGASHRLELFEGRPAEFSVARPLAQVVGDRAVELIL
jgi:hypothetical protein